MTILTPPQQRRFDYIVKHFNNLGYVDSEIEAIINTPGLNAAKVLKSRKRQGIPAHKSRANDKRLYPIQPLPKTFLGVPFNEYILKDESPINVLEGVVSL